MAYDGVTLGWTEFELGQMKVYRGDNKISIRIFFEKGSLPSWL